jgi:hypothetical protein
MILLYSLFLISLGGVSFLVRRRADSLSRRFTMIAEAIKTKIQEASKRPGNANKPDVCEAARVQFELGRLVAQRDRIEGKHFAWQNRSERLSRWIDKLRSFKGKKLPYTMGALDFWLGMSLIDQLGLAGQFNLRHLFTMIAEMMGR